MEKIYLTPSHEIPKSRRNLLLNAAMSLPRTVSEDSCSWAGVEVEEMLDIVGVGASTKLGLYTNGLGGGAGVRVTDILLDSASVDVDGDWVSVVVSSGGGAVVSSRGEAVVSSRGEAVVSSRGGVVVRVAGEVLDSEEDGESLSSDLCLFPPNTVEFMVGRNIGDGRSMVTSEGAGILMVKQGTVLGLGTSSSTVTGDISVARVDSVTSDSKAK